MLFTDEQIEQARGSDLCEIARALGYTVIRTGTTHRIKEMDSLQIFNRRSWTRFSDGTGGNAIQFVMHFGGMTFVDAVKWILERNGTVITKTGKTAAETDTEKRERVSLPPENRDRSRMHRYLEGRGLSRDTIRLFESSGLLYEDIRHNAVFVGRDGSGEARYASMRGTDERHPFKGDAPHSDKRYAFCLERPGADRVVFAESPIDIMSYYELTHDDRSCLLALGGTSPAALESFFNRHDIRLALSLMDRDGAGVRGFEAIRKRFPDRSIHDVRNVEGWERMAAKDVNEYLVHVKDSGKYLAAKAALDAELSRYRDAGYDGMRPHYIEALFRYAKERIPEDVRTGMLANRDWLSGKLEEMERLMSCGMTKEGAAVAVTDAGFSIREFEQHTEAVHPEICEGRAGGPAPPRRCR